MGDKVFILKIGTTEEDYYLTPLRGVTAESLLEGLYKNGTQLALIGDTDHAQPAINNQMASLLQSKRADIRQFAKEWPSGDQGAYDTYAKTGNEKELRETYMHPRDAYAPALPKMQTYEHVRFRDFAFKDTEEQKRFAALIHSVGEKGDEEISRAEKDKNPAKLPRPKDDDFKTPEEKERFGKFMALVETDVNDDIKRRNAYYDAKWNLLKSAKERKIPVTFVDADDDDPRLKDNKKFQELRIAAVEAGNKAGFERVEGYLYARALRNAKGAAIDLSAMKEDDFNEFKTKLFGSLDDNLDGIRRADIMALTRDDITRRADKYYETINAFRKPGQELARTTNASADAMKAAFESAGTALKAKKEEAERQRDVVRDGIMAQDVEKAVGKGKDARGAYVIGAHHFKPSEAGDNVQQLLVKSYGDKVVRIDIVAVAPAYAAALGICDKKGFGVCAGGRNGADYTLIVPSEKASADIARMSKAPEDPDRRKAHDALLEKARKLFPDNVGLLTPAEQKDERAQLPPDIMEQVRTALVSKEPLPGYGGAPRTPLAKLPAAPGERYI